MVKCPNCDGTGTVAYKGKTGEWWDVHRYRCHRCRGVGWFKTDDKEEDSGST